MAYTLKHFQTGETKGEYETSQDAQRARRNLAEPKAWDVVSNQPAKPSKGTRWT